MRLGALLVTMAVLGAGASASFLPAGLLSPATLVASQNPAEAPDGHGHGHTPQRAADGERAWAGTSPWDLLPSREAPWSDSAGRIPDKDDASLRKLANLVARTDEGLAELAAKGFLSGRGTREDPYIIEGVRVRNDLSISDTAAYLILRNSVMLGQLTLNWNGQNLHVHHNDIRDLRVNENVERVGDATGGLLEHNRIGFVGQIRHYEGEFRDNEVGPRPSGPFEDALDDAGVPVKAGDEVLNFDGFHMASMHDNTFHGLASIKLHGHDHGSCLLCPSHNHAYEDAVSGDGHAGHARGHEAAMESEEVDHADRWHTLDFRANRILVEQGPALVYRDTNHAGDDRTATSETSPKLELEHVHHTAVRIAHNTLEGGGIVLRVFNAQDERHLHGQEGVMRLADNQVTLRGSTGPAGLLGKRGGVGFDLHDADTLALELVGNTARIEPAPDSLLGGVRDEPRGTGFLLRGWTGSVLEVAENDAHGAEVGLQARDFDGTTRWRLSGNRFDAPTPVDYDRSVANPPH